jgi:hypothetical protein
MRFVTELIRPAYLADLRRSLERLALIGQGLGVLTDEEARLLRRLAYRAGAEKTQREQ